MQAVGSENAVKLLYGATREALRTEVHFSVEFRKKRSNIRTVLNLVVIYQNLGLASVCCREGATPPFGLYF